MSETTRERIREARVEMGLTQQRAAQLAHIPYSRYVRIEAGYTAPTPEDQVRIARTLDTTVKRLWPEAESLDRMVQRVVRETSREAS